MKKTLSIILAVSLCSLTAVFSAVSAKGNQKADPKKGEDVAVLHTNYGDIAMRFFDEEAPKGVENFKSLAKDGKYNNIIFHRVIKNFMIQSGDYENFDGTGGTSKWGKEFENECVDYLSNTRGAVAYANAGKDTNGSQFYINSNDNSASLDGNYTVFGQVFAGMDVVDLISDCEVQANSGGEQSSPVNEVKLESVELTQYKSGMEKSLAEPTDPYEGQKTEATEEETTPADTDAETQPTTAAADSEEQEGTEFTASDLIPIFITLGVIGAIFAAFAIPYSIQDKKRKKEKAEAKAKMKADPNYKKKKSKKKR